MRIEVFKVGVKKLGGFTPTSLWRCEPHSPHMLNDNNKRQCRHRTSMTTASVSCVSPLTAQRTPEFIRLPKSGERCPYTGMSRASLNELILGPGAPVHSVVLRREGASRGIRLIHLESLLNYLHQQMEEQINSIQGCEEEASQVNQNFKK